MELAHLISKVTTPIVMGVMYLLVLTPVGLLRRTFGGNPMVHQPRRRQLLEIAARGTPGRQSDSGSSRRTHNGR